MSIKLITPRSSAFPAISSQATAGPSRRPPGPETGRKSQPPARSKDSGGGLFLSGEHYYRQIDDLCLNICVAKKIDDQHWTDFLQASLRITNQIGRQGKVTIASFEHAHPSAWQRRLTSEFLSRNSVPTMARMGIVSDSPLVRGAVIALGWTIPKATMRSFASRDSEGCLKWLKEVASFDLEIAVAAWQEGLAQLRR